jgi:hypothetical protein
MVKKIAITLLAVAIFSGCATEAQKATNWQNEKAGEEGVKRTETVITVLPAIQGTPEAVNAILTYIAWSKQAWSDVRDNAKAIRAGQGDPAPENQKPYSPEESKKQRDEAQKKWYLVAGAAAMGLLYRVGIRYLPALAGPWGAAASSLITALAKGREDVESKMEGKDAEYVRGASEAVKTVLSRMQGEQQKSGVLSFVSRLVDRVESKLGIEHDVTLKG